METRAWTWPDTTAARAGWGEGPWLGEPDKVQWEDAATGLPCLAVRGPLGAWCGYVGVPPGHPFYGVAYNACALRPAPCSRDYCDHTPSDLLRVHGGLTFTDGCAADASEATDICHVPGPGDPAEVWWLGFDCAHAGDRVPNLRAVLSAWLGARGAYRPLTYVRQECARLAQQLDSRDWEDRLADLRLQRESASCAFTCVGVWHQVSALPVIRREALARRQPGTHPTPRRGAPDRKDRR